MAKLQITDQTIIRAVNALLKWLHLHSKQPKSKPQDDLFIYLILTLTKPPHGGRSLSLSLPLPHPVLAPVSFVFDDRRGCPFPPSSLLDAIRAASPDISHTIPLSEIQSRGELPAGLVFVDRRIVKFLPKGRKAAGRSVVDVDLKKRKWVEEVKRRVSSTELRFGGGTCCGIRVGRAGQTREEIVANVAAAVEGAVANVPKKWKSVRGFHVKAAESVALPIYEESVVKGEDGVEQKRKGEVEEELSVGERNAKWHKAGA